MTSTNFSVLILWHSLLERSHLVHSIRRVFAMSDASDEQPIKLKSLREPWKLVRESYDIKIGAAESTVTDICGRCRIIYSYIRWTE